MSCSCLERERSLLMGRPTLDPKALAAVSEQADEAQNVSSDEAAAAAYQSIADNSRIVFLYGEVSEQSISQNVYQLLHLAAQSNKPIYLVVSSYGGSVDEMFCLYDTIKFLPCPVHTVGLGKVMSAGVLLLASGVKGKRMMGRSARLMIHPVSGGIYGNVFEAVAATKEHVRIHDLLVNNLIKETNLTQKQLDKIMKGGHDYFMTAEEALKAGIIDKIIGDER